MNQPYESKVVMPALTEETPELKNTLDAKMRRFHRFIENAKLSVKPYQTEGVRWCIQRELTDRSPFTDEKRGGFLSDEMGLGKTMTMIGTIFANYQPGRNTLIVLPVILINQWYNEILKTTGNKSIIFHGDKKEITREQLDSSPIVLTSYGSISTKTNSMLLEIEWFRVVYDEAHHLRNHATTIHRNANLLKTSVCWFVTGTPIQNRTSDFKSLCVIMGIPVNENTMREVMQQSVLKRTKKSVGIMLSDTICENIEIDWKDRNEKKISDDLHEGLKFLVDEMPEVKRSPITDAVSELYSQKSRILIHTIKSRQMCVLPKLTKKLLTNVKRIAHDEDIGFLTTALQDISLYNSKIQRVVDKLLESDESGKLVFCHYREEMNEIGRMLIERGIRQSDIGMIDGRISLKCRSEIIETHPKYLLLQVQTACEGLNLQEHYSEIYFVSPNWNPAIEQQAIARCHRIGQEKQVFVYRFYMYEENRPTIEEWVFKKQKKKMELYL